MGFATAKKLGCGSNQCNFIQKKNVNVKDLPLKILDAPGMTDDFYLDVLDWGQDGSVALGIEDKVFLYKFPEGDTKEVIDLKKVRQWAEEQVIEEIQEEGAEEEGSIEENNIPEFCLNTPVRDKTRVENVTTKDSIKSDVLYLSFEDSEFSNESPSSPLSPIDIQTPDKNRISFKVENFNEGLRTPKKNKPRRFSIFDQDEVQMKRERMDSLDAIGKLNFENLLEGEDIRKNENEEIQIKKRLFDDEEEIPAFDCESEDEDDFSSSSFSLSIQEEKEESLISEESEFDEKEEENFEQNFNQNNPFLRNTNLLEENISLPDPPQLQSPTPSSPNNFLMSQVNTIVNQNFLESPENEIQPVINHAPRLSTRESMIPHKNQVIITKFNKNGKLLAVVDSKGNLYILDINTGNITHKKYFAKKITALCWSGDKVLAIGDSCGMLTLLSLDRSFDSPLLSIQMHQSEIIKIVFSQNGTHLATSGENKDILCLDLGRLRHHFYSLRGSFLQNLPELEDINQSDIIYLTTLPSMSKALVFHPLNPRYLIIGGGVDDQKIRVFDVVSKKLILKVNAGSQVCSLGFDHEGKTLISSHGFSENVIKLWNLNVLAKKLTKFKVLGGHAERVLHLAVSPCGKYIVSGSGDETLRIWECFDQERTNRGKRNYGNFMKRGISGMR
jgi:WD40 repeat protein